MMTPERVQVAREMRSEGHSLTAIAKVLGVRSSSVARALTTTEGDTSPK